MTKTVLLTGASGLVGHAISKALQAKGIQVKSLSHRDPAWNWEAGTLDPASVEGTDAVIHLAGEPIAAKRWSAAQKEKIRSSRIRGTRALAEAIAASRNGPHTFITASGSGYYGDRGDDWVDEDSTKGTGFLSDVVAGWEQATEPATQAGTRVVMFRIGLVLSADGGALAKMLPPFKMGVGGPLGNGKAWMSWVHLADVVRAFTTAVETPTWQGVYNLSTPHPVPNIELSKALAHTLSRPCIFPVPPFILRLLFGELADEGLLSSIRVAPKRLLEAGFRFEHPEIQPAMDHLLAKNSAG